MSKSKGEFLTVSLLQEKGYDPLAYRYFCLMSHYRRVLVFTWESLDNAASAYNKLISRISQIENQGELDKAAFETYDKAFREALDGDLNTSLAVTALYDVLKADISGKTKLELISSFDKVLSLDLINKAREYKEKEKTVTDDQAAEIESLISLRLEAKKAKDYAKADEIRNKLKEMGIILEDTPQGTKWKRA
jgi:cysteinyl-tRNA synthetase